MMAPPAGERKVPLNSYRKGQCLLDSSVAHFMFIANASPAQVWLDNLYLYAADIDQSVQPLIVFGSRPSSSLWLTRISTYGGGIGLFSEAPRTYVAGAWHFVGCPIARTDDNPARTPESCPERSVRSLWPAQAMCRRGLDR